MATSPNFTTQYTSEQFVESSGAILFDLPDSQKKTVCLIHYHAKNEWLLAKGRRNCGESRQEAALRETREETGYQAHLHPVTMRQLGKDGVKDMKIIWWFIAALDEEVVPGSTIGEEQFTPEFFPLQQALEKLSFQNDRDVLRKAISLVNNQAQ
ncbi:hypothetical protein N7488_003871 [Penicillium malachiteum]|nr:hypothetical protein N7488_003871 [Penicillium malachiteum]